MPEEMGSIESEGVTRISNDWKENLPADIQEWDEAKNVDTADKFWDQIKNQRSRLGDSIRIPGADAGEDQRQEFYNKLRERVDGLMPTPTDDESTLAVFKKLGLPDEADKYDTPETEHKMNPEEMGALKAMAHKAGMTNKQFKNFMGEFINKQSLLSESQKTAFDDQAAMLKGEWGGAYDQRKNIAIRIAEKTGAPSSLVDAMDRGEVDADTMRWLYGLSDSVSGEISQFANQVEAIPDTMDLQGQLADMVNNNEGPYWDSTHPGHKFAQEKALKIRRQLLES